VAHVIQIRHRDEVEAPITDWLQEAYDHSIAPAPANVPKPAARKSKTARKTKTRTSKASKTKTSRRR